jgi:hypothetical protein
LTSAQAARALCDVFLANADRGDNAANDDLVAELVQRIRALQDCANSDRSPQAAGPPGCSPLRAGGDVGG